MLINDRQSIDNFWVVGINYKKTDASVRGLFAVNGEQYNEALTNAPTHGLSELFILSTCNRTEIYGFANSAQQLANLLCSVCTGDAATFAQLSYAKSGCAAFEHLYHVAAGLDSQILGDYEILGQIKTAVKHAKAGNFIGAFTERLVNSALQASKAIKTYTELSGGTVSVSFAAVQYIKQYVEAAAGNINDKKIVLLGTGKIGRITCRNMKDYLGTQNITLINRTEETAKELATELDLRYAPIETLNEELKDADIILVSTNAVAPVVMKEHLEGKGAKLVIDMSVPCNVAIEAQQLESITFVDVDMLSKIKDETLQNRKAEIPKAVSIINEHINEFRTWYDMRKHVPVLIAVKDKLKGLNIESAEETPTAEAIVPDEKIQKVINTLATRMRSDNTHGCHYIQAINDYIA